MATISVDLDSDLHVKVKKFAEGVGVDLGELVSRCIVFALRSRYPNNELPDAELPVDPGYGVGSERPDQGLPGEQPGVDNELPGAPPQIDNSLPGGGICPVFDPEVDNELPDTPVPEPK